MQIAGGKHEGQIAQPTALELPVHISQPGDNDLGSLATQGLWPSDYIANQVAMFPWYQQDKKVTCLPHLCQEPSLACHGRGGRREDPGTQHVGADTGHVTVSPEAHVLLTH